jgi:hypothetical protein
MLKILGEEEKQGEDHIRQGLVVFIMPHLVMKSREEMLRSQI